MSLSQLLSIPCTVHRRSSSVDDEKVVAGDNRDTYGNPIPPGVDTSPVDETYDLETVCELQQRRRDEPGDAGEMSDTFWNLFLPAGVDVDTSDSVTVDGYGSFEVVGDPWPARNPRTRLQHHVEATVRRTGPEEVAS